ncbi:TPA: hypothetical protein ACXHW4_004194 [Enterobacter hormaechei]
MFALKDIVIWTHPRSGKTHTGVIVRVHQLNGSERYLVQARASVGAPPAPLSSKSCMADEIALTPRYY